MKKLTELNILAGTTLFSVLPFAVGVQASTFTEALTSGKTYYDVRLRYEAVNQDNALDDASALTLRNRLGYVTGKYEGFSATIEFEDSRAVFGADDFSVPPTGFKTGEYSVIADPQSSELDQAFVQYKDDMFTAKLGRQVITLDDHRFVGHVGWRQDRQTFDGVTLNVTPMKDFSLTYAGIIQRNRIFAEAADFDSKDHLLNAAYKTPFGKLSAFVYNIELDNDTDNGLDTVGLRFAGKQKVNEGTTALYAVSYATQDNKGNDKEADYYLIEAGVKVQGITGKIGYEVLGSDDGSYGFSTPLATLHKFNGWSDQFLGTPPQGLEDLYLAFKGKLKGGTWKLQYHDFSPVESTDALSSYGSEINVSYAKKIGKHYNAGIKYATYSADDRGVDTDKLWTWVGFSF